MFRDLLPKLNKLAGQFYTPRETRAILLFLGLGLSIISFREGKRIYYEWFPQGRSATEISQQHQQDSIYRALSQIANTQDSLFFSLPEDSLLPSSVRQRMENHSKRADLRLGSISLNRATRADLMKLPNIGPATADRIIAYRSERGRFRTLAELRNVRGIGPKHFEGMKRFLMLD
ncbi:MAG: helix-hairpin-helix domain-containing protein [Bacteroidota bacterium]|nr:helix-hairpin-helix domain-containing protein [Bacteroidota bacterium]MDP4234265.1 helix-hairpin-helix domain-containing protein [Bacteroidota bacterium]MDP4243455.1 helix-hairpin-helix domain-containing protein [Bacteroidota bacterium]MDP4289157.1 helix-hairpin-helix domain-containing protein [Bacteroidota bacterium]